MSVATPQPAQYGPLLGAILGTLLFTLGFGLGLRWPSDSNSTMRQPSESAHDEDPEEHREDEEGPHVALTRPAFENLAVRLGHPTKQDYVKSIAVPAQVVEIPGRSDLSISAPVTGVLEEVDVLPGQALVPQRSLFRIRLTDESLIDAQSRLLEAQIRQEVVTQEIARLEPLTSSGAISGSQQREFEYESRQLQAKSAALVQELRARGLPADVVENVLTHRQLAATLDVLSPPYVGEAAPSGAASGYSIEELLVHPGKSVVRGEPLCRVAYHARLYVEGSAFENDVPILRRIAEQEWPISAELPCDHDATGDVPSHRHATELPLLRIDNHVDPTTQTVRFFLELPNEVTQSQAEDRGRFDQWKYRPGQRLHLKLPVEHWQSQIVLPASAVVVEGPEVMVFVQHTLDHDDDDHDDDHYPEIFIEFEPVSVRLRHRDDRQVVLADDGSLHPEDTIALNQAYKLYLAMRMQQARGDGHAHHHEH